MPTITATIAAGGNPYTLENQPSRMNVYPPLYNLIAAPLTLIFSNTLELHRVLAAFFIIASCLLSFATTFKSSQSLMHAFSSAAIFYSGLLFYSTPIASPNSTGLFFFLACICIPWMCNFSNRSLVFAAIFGILAFFGKQYFLAGLGYVSLYLFIAISKKKAVLFGFSSFLALTTCLFIAHNTSPYFLDNTIFSVATVTAIISNDEFILKQIMFFSKTYWPLIIFILSFSLLKLYTYIKNSRSNSIYRQLTKNKIKFNITNMSSPLLSLKIDYFWFCFLCSTIIIVLILGKNPANYMTYLFQIMSPFFLIATFTAISRTTKLNWITLSIILSSFYHCYAILPKDFAVNQYGWEKLKNIIKNKNEIYAPPTVLSLVQSKDKNIYYNGHTPYFGLAIGKPDILKRDGDQSIISVWERYVLDIHKKIKTQTLDLVILDRWTNIPSLSEDSVIKVHGNNHLKSYYGLNKKLIINLPNRSGGGAYTVEIWTPNSQSNQ